MKLYDFGLTIIFIAIAGLCALGFTKHSTGYDHAEFVKDVNPKYLYASIGHAGKDIRGRREFVYVHDSVWWGMPTVQEQSLALALLKGYDARMIGGQAFIFTKTNSYPIACDPTGRYIYHDIVMLN